MKIIGLTGLAGSGKSEVSRHMVERHGFVRMGFSDIIKDEAKKRNLLEGKSYEEQKFEMSKLGEILRKESGRMDILAVKLVEKIKSGSYDKIIVDGFRSAEEVVLFRENFEDFMLLLIEVSEQARFDRRKLEDPAITIDNIRSRDKRDIEELGLGKVLGMIDYKIDNSGSIKDMEKKLDDFLSSA